jgi:uncharacterized protein (DUF885 family)
MNDSRAFEGLLDRHFEGILADHPVLATLTGLRAGEGHLGHASITFNNRQQRRRQSVLQSLDQLTPTGLTDEQHLDRLALRGQLLKDCEDHDRGRHRMDPDALDHVLNILLHELQRGEDAPARAAKNLRSLLSETPRFLAEAATLLEHPEPVWRRILEQTAAAAPSLLSAVSTFLGRHAPSQVDAALLRSAGRAFNTYRDHVLSLKPAPEGSFALGPQRLARRVRDDLGLDYTLGQIEALAESEIARVNGLLIRTCRRFGRNQKPRDILERARSEWDPPEDLLSYYQKETTRVAHAFREARAVTFPQGESLVVRPVPDFMRHLFPTAAYSAPGAFEKRQRGIFWVNDLSATRRTEADELRERRQHFGVTLTCAHEAYPGHHLQFTIANRHPRRWRRMFAHAVFYEGWTLWCEQMTTDLKVDASPWLPVQQLHDALWRCHRILVDLRLQTGRYSHRQAARHLQRALDFTRARAEADVNWYTGSPAVPMSYWLGRLENERLRRRLMRGRGWSLKRFNDWLLSFGTLPQAWIEKYGLD